MAIDSEKAGICECKYTEVPFDEKELKDLQDSALCIKQPNKFFMIFSKNGITSGVRKQIENDSNYSIITLEDLFKKMHWRTPKRKIRLRNVPVDGRVEVVIFIYDGFLFIS